MNEINFNIEDIEKIDLSMDVGIKEIYPPIENLEVIPTKEQQVFTHDNSYGYDNITVEPIPDEYIIPDGTLPITENATYDVRNYARVSASVYPAPNLQDKEITINENGTHNIVADEEYDGLNQVSVTVDAIEDLSEELTDYGNGLTEQGTIIDDITKALQNKAIGGGGSMNNYSTEEMVIGTWIDGQPLYQRTFEITTTTVDARKYLSDEFGLTNLKNVWIDESASFVSYNGITRTGIQSVNTFLSTSDYKTCYIDADGRLTLKTSSGANMTLYWTVTLRYTKTTD